MRFTIQGRSHHLDAEEVRAVLSGRRPEPIRSHWVAVGGRQWPVKQALELCTGIYRAEFTSDTARRVFQRLGFEVSEHRVRRTNEQVTTPPSGFPVPPVPESDDDVDIYAAWRRIAEHLLVANSAQPIRELQDRLRGATGEVLAELVPPGVGEAVLGWTTLVHRRAERLQTLNHGTAVVQLLHRLLAQDERILDPPNLTGRTRRGVDLHTTHRHAVFVLGRHTPTNTVRQRAAAAGLVHLVMAAPASRTKQLWASDPALLTFLQTTDLTMRWGLSRSAEALRDRFDDTYGSLDQPIRSFLAGTDVELCDVNDVLPLGAWVI
ncbi:hypothetical protein [Actinotalea caeni]|uniref:hypothetical protein n=1 Tax=Actinotalea caeni TaxID=1348467 RepID=UPI0012E0C9B9|nr:hypothetical protein [Actinotalea caeni]